MSYEVLLHDGNADLAATDPVVGGERKSRGLIPRDYATYPVGYLDCAPPLAAVDMPLIPRSEWSERIREKVASKGQLSDVRNVGKFGQPIPSLDQNGKGYCWFHSGTSCVMLLRAAMNQPYVSLSAYAGACVIKNYRDEGGWGAQGLDFLTERGVPSEEFWPQRSMSRTNDRPETWANAALHKVTEGFVDLQAAQYDRKLTFDQVGTLLLCNVPVIGDFNWWSHSVAIMDLVEGSQLYGTLRDASGKLVGVPVIDAAFGSDPVAAGYGVRILNSWGDSWSENGAGLLAGSKAIPDGATAPRSTIPSVV